MNNWRFGNKMRCRLSRQWKKCKHNLGNLHIKKNEVQDLDIDTDNVSEISNNQVKMYSIF